METAALSTQPKAQLAQRATEGCNEFSVYFDGGDSGQDAYGSWEVIFVGLRSFKQNRIRFPILIDGMHVTSNVAEYCALIDALEWLQTVLNKADCKLEIFGDSKLVVQQVNGRWKVHKPHLRVLRDKVLLLLKEFGEWKLSWYRRKHNVSRFGH